MADVLIIGAGVGGLCAAIRCAKAGHRVQILEAASEAGGKLATVRVEGLELDTGPSVLTLPAILDEALALAGEPPLELVAPDPWMRASFADGTRIDLGRGASGAVAGVRDALGPLAASDLGRFLERARRMWEVAAPRFVFAPAPTLASVAQAPLRELLTIQPLTRLWDWIQRDVRDHRLQALLARFATYAGSDARKAPAVLGTIAWVELGLGGFGVRGGMGRVRDRCITAARKLGVQLRFGARVERLEVAKGRVRAALEAGGRRWEADAVISNDPAALAEILPAEGAAPPAGETSYSGRCVVFRTAKEPLRPAHEVRFAADYGRELIDLGTGRQPADPSIYLCAPRLAHEAPAWSGDEPIFAMLNAPALAAGAPDDSGETAWVESLRARLVGARLLGPAARPVWWRTAGGLAKRFGAGGALYGQASHSWASAFRRPANRVPSVRGLYLCGGAAHPGGGLPLVASSGRLAAEALIEDLAREKQRPSRSRPAAVGAVLLALPLQPPATPAVVAGDAVEGARIAFRRADHAQRGKEALFADAVERAESAVRAWPRSGPAHFWLGVSLAASARERGLLALIRSAGEVREHLEAAAQLDSGYLRGAPLAALCSLYHHAPAPPFSFGDAARSRLFCERALAHDPRSWEALIVLAEQELSRGESSSALGRLALILHGPLDAREPELHRRYRRSARKLLAGALR